MGIRDRSDEGETDFTVDSNGSITEGWTEVKPLVVGLCDGSVEGFPDNAFVGIFEAYIEGESDVTIVGDVEMAEEGVADSCTLGPEE